MSAHQPYPKFHSAEHGASHGLIESSPLVPVEAFLEYSSAINTDFARWKVNPASSYSSLCTVHHRIPPGCPFGLMRPRKSTTLVVPNFAQYLLSLHGRITVLTQKWASKDGLLNYKFFATGDFGYGYGADTV